MFKVRYVKRRICYDNCAFKDLKMNAIISKVESRIIIESTSRFQPDSLFWSTYRAKLVRDLNNSIFKII